MALTEAERQELASLEAKVYGTVSPPSGGGTSYASKDEFLADTRSPLTGQPAPQRPAPKTTTTGRYMLQEAEKAPIGLLSMAALPADLIAAGVNATGALPERLPMPGQIMRQSLERLFNITNYAPADQMQKFGGHMAQFVTGGLPFSARAVALAPNKIPAVTGEAAGTMAGGVGSYVGGEVAEGLGINPAWGQVVGGIGGQAGSAVAAKPMEMATNATARILGLSDDATRAAEVQRLAGRTLGKSLEATRNAEAEFARTGAAQQRFKDIGAGDAQLTLGQRTGAKGVMDTENALMRSGPLELERGAQQAERAQAVVERGTKTLLPGEANVSRLADSTLRKAENELSKRLDRIEAQQRMLASSATTGSQEMGVALTKARDAAENQAKAINRQNYNAVYEAANQAPKIGQQVAQDMDEIGALVRQTVGSDRNAYTPLPAVFQKVAFRTKPEELTGRSIDPELMAASAKKPPTFEELHSMYKEANREFYQAERAGRTDLMGPLNMLRSKLGEAVAKYEGTEFGDVAGKLKAANDFYANTYRRAFREGVGGRMDATGRYGDILAREQVAGKFLTPSGIDDFYAIYKNDPAAHNLLQDAFVAKFQAEATSKNGVLDPASARKFMADNRETLSKVPEIERILSDKAATTEALALRGERIKLAQKDLSDSIVAQIAKTDDPKGLAAKALTDQRTMMAMIAQARDARSRGAVGRLIADAIPEVAAKAGVTPFEFLMQNSGNLRPAIARLGPGHWKNLEDIATMQTAVGRAQIPQHANIAKGSDPIMEMTGSTARTVNTEIRAVTQGRQSETNALLHLLSRFGIKKGEEAVAKAQAEAIYNPELATAMVAAARNPQSQKATNDLRNALLASGMRIAASTDADQK